MLVFFAEKWYTTNIKLVRLKQKTTDDGEMMKHLKSTLRFLAVIAVFAAAFALGIFAEDITYSKETSIIIKGGSTASMLDRNESSYMALTAEDSIELQNPNGIASVYILFDRLCGEWNLKSGSQTVSAGTNGFLHEYVDVMKQFGGHAPTSLTLHFPSGAQIAEIYVFSEGELPDYVQLWEPPCEKADLMLLSTHSDDEHLFLAGILPYYAMAKGYYTQVVYFTNHWDTHIRAHEQLNGLWKVGVRNYPIIPEFPDLYSTSLEGAQSVFSNAGYKEEDFIEYYVTMIRRFKPLVIVGHDEKGEYGHGAHILNTYVLKKALDLAADETAYSNCGYDAWNVPKTYLHLYPENPIVMNWDEPLEALGGKTAYEVAREGYLEHHSQHWMWFFSWFMGENSSRTTAASIETYSPCNYGLFRSTVGLDTLKNDFFENLTVWDRQDAENPADTSDVTETATDALTDAPTGEKDSGTNAVEEQHVSAKGLRLIGLTAILAVAAAVISVLFVRKKKR